MIVNYTDAPFSIIEEKVGKNFVLLVTATNKETDHLHVHIKPIDNSGNLYRIYKGSLIYYLGVLGYYNVIHVQCGMGATSRDASIMTVSSTINDINPKVVIMIGIAFGIDEIKQKIGDVLVSETILPYEFTRVGTQLLHRSNPAYASKVLVSRFKGLRGWEYKLPDEGISRVITANVLSGEKLIDNVKFRDKLRKAYPLAHGGEMEGSGLFAACDGKADWLLIKGICDFADGQKGKNKDHNQTVAVEAAIATSMILFKSKYSFDGLEIKPINEIQDEVIVGENSQINVDLSKIIEHKPVIQLPTSPALIEVIVEDILNNNSVSNDMIKQIQDLVKAFLSLTEVDKIGIARKLDLESASMIEMPKHIRDKVIFAEIKSKNLLAELWDEVFSLIESGTVQNPFKQN